MYVHMKNSFPNCDKRQSKNSIFNVTAKFRGHLFCKELFINMYAYIYELYIGMAIYI